MEFTNPLYIVGLLGLLVPLLIHLWNRNTHVVIQVGSTKLLETSEANRANKIQFQDLWLFLLRAIIIACAVFLIIQPFYQKTTKTKAVQIKNWLLIEPNLLDKDEIKNLINNYSNHEKRVLQNDFPILKDSTKIDTKTNDYYQLLNSLNSQENAPDSIIIFSNTLLKNFKSPIPTVPTNIAWKQIPIFEKNEFVISATKTGESDQNYLKINTKETVTQNDTIHLHLLKDKKYNQETNYFKAAIKAIKKASNTPIKITESTETNTEKSDYLICFADSSKCKTTSQIILQYNPQENKQKNITYNKKINQYTLQKNLKSINTQLPKELADLLLKPNKTQQKIIQQNDQRTLTKSQLKIGKYTSQDQSKDALNTSPRQNRKTKKQTLHTPILLTLLLLITIERIASQVKTS